MGGEFRRPTYNRFNKGQHLDGAFGCECNSTVEFWFSKPIVTGSNPVIRFLRSRWSHVFTECFQLLCRLFYRICGDEDHHSVNIRLPSPKAETEDLKSSQCGFESHGSYFYKPQSTEGCALRRRTQKGEWYKGRVCLLGYYPR